MEGAKTAVGVGSALNVWPVVSAQKKGPGLLKHGV